ncbi:MAG: TAXI family TRAP transporter solute-binding subunit [Rickettsiales bacterium]|nr:MAG: TAXI family TRAP transporter solute-binding subunit [Rickettsiales bacterium]
MQIKKKSPFLIIILLTNLALGKSAISGNDKIVNIGTGNITGIYYPAGAAICKLVNKHRKNHHIRCAVEPTSGSAYNIQGLNNKQLDLAIVQSDVEYFAYNGIGAYSNSADKNLRFLFSLHNDAFAIVTRAGANIRNFEDIKGKRINLGNIGSGSRYLIEQLFKLYGWETNDFELITELKASDQPEALCSNKIDVMIYSVGHPNGAVQEAVSSCETSIIPIDDEKIKKFISKHPYYIEAVIPGGMYPGNPDPIKTFGVKTDVIAEVDLQEDIVYNIVKSVFDDIEKFKALHPVFNNLKIEDMIKQEEEIIPLHPGAKKYFKEKNLL